MKKILIFSIIVILPALLFIAPTYAFGDQTAEETKAYLAVSEEELLEFADEFLDRRTAGLISAEVQSGEAEFIDSIDTDLISEAAEVYEEEAFAIAELNDRREVLGDSDVRYTDYENEITLISTEIEDDVVRLTVEESAKLYYDQITGEEPEYTAWKTERVFEFQMTESGWILISQHLVNERDPIPSNEPAGV